MAKAVELLHKMTQERSLFSRCIGKYCELIVPPKCRIDQTEFDRSNKYC